MKKTNSVMARLICSFILFLLLGSDKLFSQDRMAILKLSPQHFITSTMKLDFEMFNGQGASWLISPLFSVLDKSDERVYGAGLEIGRRFYILREDITSPNGFYTNVSVDYNYYNTWYTDVVKKTDSSYYYPVYYNIEQEHYEKIHQVGADFYFGYQATVKNLLFIDIFFGGGTRLGFSSRDRNSYYKEVFLDYAYSGIIPKAGIKIGIKIH